MLISTYNFNLLIIGFFALLAIIAIFAEFPGRFLKPVSYTHLDVYKRQVYNEVERLIGCECFTAYQVQINSECVIYIYKE